MFETDRQLIVGDMTLPRRATRAASPMPSTVPTSPSSLTNVEITSLDGGDEVPFIVLAKSPIRLAYTLARLA